MTCPRCRFEFESPKSACPECGIPLARSVSGVMKTSAVFIATGGERSFYRSVQEVPEPLRTQLLETTTSANSGTIVIADKAGKEQLSQALLRRTAAQEPAEEPLPEKQVQSRRTSWLAWMAVAFILIIGTLLSILFHVRW